VEKCKRGKGKRMLSNNSMKEEKMDEKREERGLNTVR
jgi:hypothetical protein